MGAENSGRNHVTSKITVTGVTGDVVAELLMMCVCFNPLDVIIKHPFILLYMLVIACVSLLFFFFYLFFLSLHVDDTT